MIEEVAPGWDCHVHVFDAQCPVRNGHYPVQDRPLAQIESLAQLHGVGHLVLVQPSVYGTDNSVLLQALAIEPGRHRGVVVVDRDVGDAELDTMHCLGVRGVRFNLVSPVGEIQLPTDTFTALAPRLRLRGWHVQWYARPADLPAIEALHRGSGLTCVLDHLAGLHARVAADGPAWRALEALAAQEAWIKVSGLYRLYSAPPYTELLSQISRVAMRFEGRLVWGSDWPHTMFSTSDGPSYESNWQPVLDAIGPEAAEALRRREPAIYSRNRLDSGAQKREQVSDLRR